MPIQKLGKILRLEAEKLEDRAVIGGLSSFATTWQAEAGRSLGPDGADWVNLIAQKLRTYSSQSTQAARRAAIADLLGILERPPEPSARISAPDAEARAPAPAQPASPSESAQVAAPLRDQLGLDSAVTALQGVGPRQAQRLAKLGLRTLRDMLYFFPRRHIDYSQLKPIARLEVGETVSIIAQVKSAGTFRTHKGVSVFKAVLSDPSGSIEATWFNQPFLAGRIKAGQSLVVSGKLDQYLGTPHFTSPQWEKLEAEQLHTLRLVPVYPLTEGVYPNWLRSLMKRTVGYWSRRLPDHLPAWVRAEHELPDLENALAQAHFPDSLRELKRAQTRLAFDELFVLQVGLQRQRQLWRAEPGQRLSVDASALDAFVCSLPFPLTGAQERALQGIVADMRSDRPMSRLLQGDVGSGKTVVAAAAMAMAVAAGAQAALMAPTEILAEQHLRTLSRLFASAPGRQIRLRLLTGSTSGQERKATYAGMADGSIDVVVGTHALIQGGVAFKQLGFAVIDEQHRFGVRQRAALRQKGYNPHLLVMTATPIPRSLQLTIWGHMDVAVIDQFPPGRQPIETRLVEPSRREQAYRFVETQIAQGRQAFVICPLVEESDTIEARAAVDEHARLQSEVFPHLRLGLLHGRMKSDDKEATMGRFLRRELDILVSTSVVEVGVDVANATVMLIEGANRFGLSQLHQFRGRVGRGEHPSYCLLFSDERAPAAGVRDQLPGGDERLRAIVSTTDGFALAQKDLDLRGPGEFLGTRQSGFPALRFAELADLPMLESVREAAQRVLVVDPELRHPDHRLLARQVALVWASRPVQALDSLQGEVS